MQRYPHGGKRPIVGVLLPPDLAAVFGRVEIEDDAGPTLLMQRALIHFLRRYPSPLSPAASALLAPPTRDEPVSAEGQEGASRTVTARLPEAIYEALVDIEQTESLKPEGLKRPDILRQAFAGYLAERIAAIEQAIEPPDVGVPSLDDAVGEAEPGQPEGPGEPGPGIGH